MAVKAAAVAVEAGEVADGEIVVRGGRSGIEGDGSGSRVIVSERGWKWQWRRREWHWRRQKEQWWRQK